MDRVPSVILPGKPRRRPTREGEGGRGAQVATANDLSVRPVPMPCSYTTAASSRRGVGADTGYRPMALLVPPAEVGWYGVSALTGRGTRRCFVGC